MKHARSAAVLVVLTTAGLLLASVAAETTVTVTVGTILRSTCFKEPLYWLTAFLRGNSSSKARSLLASPRTVLIQPARHATEFRTPTSTLVSSMPTTRRL